jgi:hypothetical protein
MAAIAPVTPSATPSAASPAAGSSAPASSTPGLGVSSSSQNTFTAFPSSYAGFGSDGNGFGSLTIKNGSLGVDPGTKSTTSSTATADPQTTQQKSDPPDPSNTGVYLDLVSARERVAFAESSGNTAAVTQLQPIVTQLTGQLYNQEFAGLGQTPAQPFAKPEIPYIFLNYPA